MTFENVLTALVLFLAQSAGAQSCWRTTTCSAPTTAAFPGPWNDNIYAPSSRTINPVTVLSYPSLKEFGKYGSVAAGLQGNGSTLSFDFGIEVGGIATIKYSTSSPGQLGIGFTEAKDWIMQGSDDSNGKFVAHDGYLTSNFSAAGTYTYVMPDAKLRGGFRYLTLFLLSNATSSTLNITDIQLEIGFAPTWSNLKAYQGYFHCNDDMLNKIWYSGAYTLQTNAVPVDTGREVPMVSYGWSNNGLLGNGSTIIVDGAKRDRAVWPGDMGVAVPSSFVSLGDLDSVKNALQVMYDHQNADGSFPEAGPPLLQQGSDTYHMWSMIGTYNYVLYSNDTAFLDKNWAKYLMAMNYVYGKVHAPGLLNVTGTRDWARWQQGFNNTEANMILYHTLLTGSELATWASAGSANLSSTYASQAAALKTAINSYCYDESYGAFRDNATSTTLYPQDANSFALLFNATYINRTSSILTNLQKNWTPLGPETPELPGNISPFISSFELQGRFTVGDTAKALELLRTTWGWYLNNPNGTQSTVIEGYRTNGSFGYRQERGYSYDPSYVSHAHGWSSGPTSALTNFVAGLSVTGRAGSTWSVAPQFGDLKYAEAGFTTSLGQYSTGWNLLGKVGYDVWIKTPRGTKGEVTLPVLQSKKAPTVIVNGRGQSCRLTNDGAGATFSLDGGNYFIAVL